MSTNAAKTQFRHQFRRLAEQLGFTNHNIGFFKKIQKHDVEMVIVLRLLNSRWSNGFDAWTYVFADGLFGRKIVVDRSIFALPCAFARVEQSEFGVVFDLDSSLSLDKRTEKLELFFQTIVMQVESLIVSVGFAEVANQALGRITPPVRAELERLGVW